jgi:hypothetical protein
MKHEIESFLNELQKLAGPIGTLKITQTIIDKGNPDANKSIIAFAALFGIDFAAMEKGGANGETLQGKFQCSGETCKIKFYKTKTRGDNRLSISGLKKHAKAGDVIAMRRCAITGALIINATKETQSE